MDLISRQAAIDALKGLPTWWADEGGCYGGAQPPMVALLDPEDAVSAIENLPSAQPATNCSEIPNGSDDTISRQMALDAFGLSEKTRKYGGDHSGYDTRMLYEIQDTLESLPAVQPDHNADISKKVEGDCISRQAAIDALHMHLMYRMGTDSNKKRLDDWINSLPSAQGKPFNLPEIYIADGYDTIEDEDGNVGFGVYVPDENQIYVAGDVEGEIRARALLHEICHWVQAMCGRSFDEDEANEFSDIVYDALPSAQPERRRGKES